MSNCVVWDRNGVRWSVAEEDVIGWTGNREYAHIREGAKKVKILDPNYKQAKRDFKGENPHPEFLPYDQEIDGENGRNADGTSFRVNPLWEEWESSKAMEDKLSPALAAILVLGFFLLAVLAVSLV